MTPQTRASDLGEMVRGTKTEPVQIYFSQSPPSLQGGDIQAMLTVATFDVASDIDEAKERLSKFLNFYELTPVENNCLFKIQDDQLFR